MEFLVSKNLISDDKMAFKRLLHRMWFALYPRSRRTMGSCAFEHIFLGIVKYDVALCSRNFQNVKLRLDFDEI